MNFDSKFPSKIEVHRGDVSIPFIRFGILIGEVCYNLRSALDYLVYELAILDTGHFLKHAEARVTANPASKSTFVEIGDIYPHEAEKLKCAHALNTPAVEAIIEPQVI